MVEHEPLTYPPELCQAIVRGLFKHIKDDQRESLEMHQVVVEPQKWSLDHLNVDASDSGHGAKINWEEWMAQDGMKKGCPLPPGLVKQARAKEMTDVHDRKI